MRMDRNTQRLVTPASQPNAREDSAGMHGLVLRLGHAVKPVAPAPEFRARLRDGLRMAAYHREARNLLVQPRTETPWGLLVGAAALGSAAGLLAFASARARAARRTSGGTDGSAGMSRGPGWCRRPSG